MVYTCPVNHHLHLVTWWYRYYIYLCIIIELYILICWRRTTELAHFFNIVAKSGVKSLNPEFGTSIPRQRLIEREIYFLPSFHLDSCLACGHSEHAMLLYMYLYCWEPSRRLLQCRKWSWFLHSFETRFKWCANSGTVKHSSQDFKRWDVLPAIYEASCDSTYHLLGGNDARHEHTHVPFFFPDLFDFQFRSALLSLLKEEAPLSHVFFLQFHQTETTKGCNPRAPTHGTDIPAPWEKTTKPYHYPWDWYIYLYIYMYIVDFLW